MAARPALVLPNVLANPALPQVPWTPSMRPAELERSLTEHWIFDSGNSDCLVGGLRGDGLTLAGAAPSYSPGYLTTASGGRNGLITPYFEQETQTQFAVVRKDSIVPGGFSIPLYGTYSDGDTASGHMTYQIGGYFDAVRTSGGNVTTTQVASTASPSVGNWMFVATVHAPESRMVYVGGVGTFSDTPNKVKSTRRLAIGNAYYNISAWMQSLLVAEYGVVLGYALSADDLDDFYVRSKVRQARRSKTVY